MVNDKKILQRASEGVYSNIKNFIKYNIDYYNYMKEHNGAPNNLIIKCLKNKTASF